MSIALKPSTHLNFNAFVKASGDVYPSNSISSLVKQLIFYYKAKKNNALIQNFSQEINQLGYGHIFEHEPSVLGNLIWPYIHKDWDVAERFFSIAKHYSLLKNLPKFLDVSNGLPKEMISLNAFSPNAAIVLDKPRWFVREGEIVLNIFQDDLRVMSIAFSLGNHNNEVTLFVGGIQGIHSGVASDKSLEIIKQLTKDFHGLRPRSFVIAALRMIATRVGASKILAVDQAHRHHFHPYFKSSTKSLNNANYDEIWRDHEGVPQANGFYYLKTSSPHKDLTEIDSKKRSMYRKRYEMLDLIEQQILQLS
jgi:uncharacterized protein VirK/YbjX